MSAQIAAKKMCKEVKQKIAKAQSIKLPWNEVCNDEVLQVVQAQADAIGAPKEYIFFPMLTVIASFMGVNASCMVNQEWSEPAILWNVIGACKGEKKTAAMKRLLRAVEVSRASKCFLIVSLSVRN